jgi:pto-interacting protein 1
VAVVEVPEVSLREVNEITGSFSGEKLIGQGSYAKVYRATMRNGRHVVVKRLEKPSKHASNVVFLKQLSVASRLKHDNFVRLLGYTISGGLRLLVYEFATMGTLYDVLHGDRAAESPRPVLSWMHRVHIALDAARGLEYLHGTTVTHKDLRSTNVLLFEGYRAKIADYNMFSQAADMARLNRSTHTLGSFGYQAPEYVITRTALLCSALSLSDRPFELVLSTDVFFCFLGGLCSGTP